MRKQILHAINKCGYGFDVFLGVLRAWLREQCACWVLIFASLSTQSSRRPKPLAEEMTELFGDSVKRRRVMPFTVGSQPFSLQNRCATESRRIP